MKRIILTAAIFIFLSGMIVQAQTTTSAPPLINYQGRLTDNSGIGLTGTKTLEFNIYDAVSGGTKVWGPQIFNTVPLVDGYFNVILGTTDSAGRSVADAFGSNTRFLGVTYDSKEIVPRQQILSVPYAIQVNNDKRFSPVGSIIAWHKTMGSTPDLPDGWVECNGQVLNDPLSSYNGKTIPNLNSSNRFLQGSLMSGETGGNSSHNHTYSGTTDYALSGGDQGEGFKFDEPSRRKHRHNYSGATQESSNIPPYFSVVWIMRVR